MNILPAILLLIPALACAAPGASAPRGQARFGEMKAKLLQEHAQRIQILQASQSCIQAAQTPPALKACMETQRQQMEALRPPR
ncbi:hypothetical protein KIF53_06885 [Chromobacterium subtsugae]|uniref:Uncharacterized protein n=1 Tax=Chromobacterium subtsugae TaxID=251747 RepID=A0ABS7FB96_9NEIS|nr:MULTISPECIES: hypothetical protein [Chromobacterium]KUM01666.1 hypothetical protein Cv017_07005 [Chromobacterium subtsugae]KZE84539.1 hypothetical protein AWB61_03845 [Chromobacterium sp. F49]MBW7566231.1 hypothetical protein [Chromobacterium subtsugae]MBW8287352.1 hypothetical protein [Chromobacterium subtsugae]WSE90456.1 hypothetical protein U6115_16370 [Chromobacterium subtsugae]